MGEILSRVWEETELDLFHSGLQIRAFPLDGGCRLFLKRKRGQKHRRREAEPVAADFESWADLCRGAEFLRGKGVRRMAIYRWPEGWRLLFMGKGQPGAWSEPCRADGMPAGVCCFRQQPWSLGSDSVRYVSPKSNG